jgi:hypothetical protein
MPVPLRDYRGRELRPVTSRQAAKLEALRRSEPSLLLLGQDEAGTVRFSIRARFLHGRLREARAGQVEPGGRLVWHADVG